MKFTVDEHGTRLATECFETNSLVEADSTCVSSIDAEIYLLRRLLEFVFIFMLLRVIFYSRHSTNKRRKKYVPILLSHVKSTG